MTPRTAAQYVRMSTDRQDLSPFLQKEAMGEFALAHGYEIVRTYEDHGKSGVHIANRPALRRLLSDVQLDPPFNFILVYDVSRWGRFQDADAAAYYEFHCRLSNVQVVYVAESFDNAQTPASVLLKGMRRLMAAEYSRDLARKSRAGQGRVVSMGFHMGTLPSFGYRRWSVSADGKQRVELKRGQMKMALTDRIEWVLGPPDEVQLVQRIFDAFANRGLEIEQIAGLVRAEGWRSDKYGVVTPHTVRTLLTNEALIGNFVWGPGVNSRRIVPAAQTRCDGSVPRIIDTNTWTLTQRRLMDAHALELTRPKYPLPHSRPGASHAHHEVAPRITEVAEANYAAGSETPTWRKRWSGRVLQSKEFGVALAKELSRLEMPATFDARFRLLSLWTVTIRIRVFWLDDRGRWKAPPQLNAHMSDYTLAVRASGPYTPLDYFLIPTSLAEKKLPNESTLGVPRKLRPYRLCDINEVVKRIHKLATEAEPAGEISTATARR